MAFPITRNPRKTKTIIVACATMLPVFLSVPGSSLADTFGTGTNQFTIEFVTIGNPGNPPDMTGKPNPAGSVPYVYRIGKYEISRDAIEKANAEGNLGIRLDDMAFVTGGPRPNMPFLGTRWNEAARFVNFLNTSQGYPPAYKFATQPGEPGYDANAHIELWQAGDAGYGANNLLRNSQAHYFLPSVDEWYKAAYYDPHANDGLGGYWDYPTGSDEVPTPIASGTDAFTAVWEQPWEQGPADIMQAGGLSPYGTMAQGGNVWEWEETPSSISSSDVSSFRGSRGGQWLVWTGRTDPLSSSARFGHPPEGGFALFSNGFRVASIPEPSAALLGALGVLGLLNWRRRLG